MESPVIWSSLENISIDSRNTKTKVITTAKHTDKNKTSQGAKENAIDRVTIGFIMIIVLIDR